MSTTQLTAAEHPPAAERPTHPCCGRRTVLRAAGLVALSGGAVALGACSADSAGTSPSGEPSSAAPSESSSTPSASAAESASPSTATSTVPDGTPVAISDVAVGGGVVVDEKYVVTQPTDGEFKAFSAICTHQGCPVGSVEDGAIICPCHNSHFDISTGDPVEGPAQEPLPAVQLTKAGDSVYVSG